MFFKFNLRLRDRHEALAVIHHSDFQEWIGVKFRPVISLRLLINHDL